MELAARGRDLQDPQMWKKQNCLSDNELKRWEKACDAVMSADLLRRVRNGGMHGREEQTVIMDRPEMRKRALYRISAKYGMNGFK